MQVLLLTAIGLLLFCKPIASQQVNRDSASLVAKIRADQLKLEKLQSQLTRKTDDKQDALDKAQRAASKNSNAADKLSDDPDNRKLARKAHKKARNARKDSRNARKESARLDELNKDIQQLKERIAENEKKLNKYLQNGRANRITPDTTHF
jgi:hypothetical protein